MGDAHMRKFNILITSKSNARLRFLQSVAQSDFIYYLYELFKDFFDSTPKESSSLIKETSKIRYNFSFATRNLPCFNELYLLFYKNRIKVIPSNIKDLLTPISHAYWIMGDDYWTGSGQKLHTNNYSKEEVNLLINV